MTYTLLGAALLWFGWFGFNAGSAFAANELAVNAFLNMNTAAAVSVTFLLAKSLDRLIGLRVRDEEEAMGLDNSQHRESAYTLID
jgi:ammonia channel protein AmtB